MSILRPFRALRPVQNNVAQVASVPYDVVNFSEAKSLAKNSSWSFLRVTRAEVDLPEETDPHSEAVYSHAKTNLDELVLKCPFLTEASPSLYLYRLRMTINSVVQEQTGIVATYSLDEYDKNQIKKHELTRRDKEDDRVRHIQHLNAQTGPVFLAYRGTVQINHEVEKWKATAPLYDFVSEDGVGHTIWLISEPQVLVEHFASQVSSLYIADGHHRNASASRVRADLKKQGQANATSLGDPNFFLGVAFPEEQLKILPYHRLVKDLAGRTTDQFLKEMNALFEVTPGSNALPLRGEFGMYCGGKWYLVKKKTGVAYRSPTNALDVAFLQDELLGPVLGIGNPRTDQRIAFVGGIRGTGELESRVNSGEAAVAFSLHPTQMKDVMAISDEGGIMPPKSTWFEPKLRDGILVHRW